MHTPILDAGQSSVQSAEVYKACTADSAAEEACEHNCSCSGSEAHITHDNQKNNTYVNACSVNIGREFPPIVKNKLTLVTLKSQLACMQIRLNNIA